MWRTGTARLKAAREAEVLHDAERGDFLHERKRLEQAVASAGQTLADFSDREEHEAAEFAARRSSVAAFSDELTEQRHKRIEVDNQLRAAEAQLASLRDAGRKRIGGISTDSKARLEAETSKLSNASLELAGVSQERKKLAEELQEKTVELDSLRHDYDELATENERLRQGLHWGLQSLERIQNELIHEPSAAPASPRSQPRENSAPSRGPSFGYGDRGGSFSHGMASSSSSFGYSRPSATRWA